MTVKKDSTRLVELKFDRKIQAKAGDVEALQLVVAKGERVKTITPSTAKPNIDHFVHSKLVSIEWTEAMAPFRDAVTQWLSNFDKKYAPKKKNGATKAVPPPPAAAAAQRSVIWVEKRNYAPLESELDMHSFTRLVASFEEDAKFDDSELRYVIDNPRLSQYEVRFPVAAPADAKHQQHADNITSKFANAIIRLIFEAKSSLAWARAPKWLLRGYDLSVRFVFYQPVMGDWFYPAFVLDDFEQVCLCRISHLRHV